MKRKNADPFNEKNGEFRAQSMNEYNTKIILAAMKKMNCYNRAVFVTMALLDKSKSILGHE